MNIAPTIKTIFHIIDLLDFAVRLIALSKSPASVKVQSYRLLLLRITTPPLI